MSERKHSCTEGIKETKQRSDTSRAAFIEVKIQNPGLWVNTKPLTAVAGVSSLPALPHPGAPIPAGSRDQSGQSHPRTVAMPRAPVLTQMPPTRDSAHSPTVQIQPPWNSTPWLTPKRLELAVPLPAPASEAFHDSGPTVPVCGSWVCPTSPDPGWVPEFQHLNASCIYSSIPWK